MCPSVCSHNQTFISVRPATYQNEIPSEAALGRVIGCIRFWARSDHNSAFMAKLLPWGFYMEILASTIAPPFLIGSSSFLQVTSTTIKSGTGLNLSMIRPGKNPHRLITKEML